MQWIPVMGHNINLCLRKMLEYISDKSKSHTNINRRVSCFKVSNSSKERQSERKRELKATKNMGKGLQKVLKTLVKEISQDLPPPGEYGS